MSSHSNQQAKSVIQEYVELYPIALIRSQCISLLLLPNLLLIIVAFADPFKPMWAWILLILLFIIDLLGLPIVISPRKLQREYVLFLGLLGLLSSSAFMLAANKLAYASLHMTTLIFGVVSTGGYVIVMFLLYRVHIKLLYIGKYRNDEDESKENTTKQQIKLKRTQTVILLFAGLGIVVGNTVVHWLNGYNSIIIVVIIILCFFSLVYMLISSNLHKYILIRRNL